MTEATLFRKNLWIKLSYRPNSNTKKNLHSEIRPTARKPHSPLPARLPGLIVVAYRSGCLTHIPYRPASLTRLDGPHEMGDELEYIVVGIEVPQRSPIVAWGSNRCITSPGTAPRKIGGGMVMHTSSAMVLLREHLSQPHSLSLQAVRTLSLTMNHVLSHRLVLQERFPPSPLCVPPLPFLSSPLPAHPSFSLTTPSQVEPTSGAARWAKTPSPPLMRLRLAPPMELRRLPPMGLRCTPPLPRC